MTSTAYKHRADPVLVLARRMRCESAGWAWFGIHAPEDPTYEGDHWNEPFSPEVGSPPWRGDVLRVVWTGPFLLPDERELPRVPTPLEINSQRLPWLVCGLGPGGELTSGMPLSMFVPAIVEMAGGVYVPIDGIGSATWREWDALRVAALKAGRYAEDR